MTKPIDESYVKEIIQAAKRHGPMNAKEFWIFCKSDINGGYLNEVEEAERRIFGKARP